jgi:hypothetical protein
VTARARRVLHLGRRLRMAQPMPNAWFQGYVRRMILEERAHRHHERQAQGRAVGLLALGGIALLFASLWVSRVPSRLIRRFSPPAASMQ